MQNMYVGDIGDYGKYGLLRALSPSCKNLGIIWYLVPDEKHLNDGKHTDYLSKLKFIDCDRSLFSILKNIISSGKRNVSGIEQSDIFTGQTVYYSSFISYNGIKANSPKGRQQRLMLRDKWINDALNRVQDCDTLFLDPDNGLEVPSASKYSAKAPKYAYYDEIERFLAGRDTLIIYHHLGRNGSHESQIKQREKELRDIAGKGYEVVSLKFRPYSPRAYFIITNQKQITGVVNKFLDSNWKQCFETARKYRCCP